MFKIYFEFCLKQIGLRCWDEWCNSVDLVFTFCWTFCFDVWPSLHQSWFFFMKLLIRGLVNDMYKMDLILVHSPHLIGLACIYVASMLKEIENDAWFEDLRVDMNMVIVLNCEHNRNRFFEFSNIRKKLFVIIMSNGRNKYFML